MQKTVRFFLLVVLSLSMFVFPPEGAAGPEKVLRFAGQFPEGHTSTELMKTIADEVREKTGGRIEIALFPANELGDYSLVYEELIRGSIDMAAITVPSQFDPRLELPYVNCIVRTFEGARKLLAPDGWLFARMDRLHARLGVKLLGFQMEGFIGIGSTKPVNEPLNPDSKKGILLRIPNMESFRLAAEAMGYNTITIPWDEVLGSLQNGFAEGVFGMTPTAAQTMLKGVIKYWYDLHCSIENLNYMISLKTWEKLSEEDRAIISEVCSKVTGMSIDLAEADQKKHLEQMREDGVEVHTYGREELTPLFARVASTWEKLGDKLSKELVDDLVSRYAEK